MGNLLLVDDEPDILQSLEELFKYESNLDIDVYVAKSADSAIELLEKIKFDVVMTDIKMPGMSGIELFKQIKENWPKCRVIFLTGYRNFDSLYEISGHKDVRFLLKSEEDSVLVAAVGEAFEEINKMILSESQQMEQRSEIEKAQMILRNNAVKGWMKRTPAAVIKQKKLDRLQIPIEVDSPLFIFLLHIDYFDKNIDFEEEIHREKLLCETIKEFLPPRFSFYLYYDTNGYYLLYLQPNKFIENSLSARKWKSLYNNLAGAMEYVQEKNLMLSSLSVSFVICDERCYFKDTHSYLIRLKQEAIHKVGDSMQRIVVAQSVNKSLKNIGSSVNFPLHVKNLEELLETKKFDDFIHELQELTAAFYRETECDISAVTELYYNIALFLMRYINVNHLKGQIEAEVPLDKLIYMEKHSSLAEAANYLYAIANSLIGELEAGGHNRTNEAIDRVVQYINAHLADDLTLTKLAEISFLNPSYLSRIFKQNYGCNLTEYISKIRLEQAKKLLSSTPYKINDIAARVGYLSAPSFTRVFKKLVGITPLEYREKLWEKES
ncbi:MAG TPA: response regulator [Candidatus Pelethocola excrementipullorum]|nr:response regulator [Candidatus Pelethocola excrementipullorum]